jgi:hypothetical protein
MPEIGTSGSTSGDGKRSAGHWPQATAPILDSTPCPRRQRSNGRSKAGGHLTLFELCSSTGSLLVRLLLRGHCARTRKHDPERNNRGVTKQIIARQGTAPRDASGSLFKHRLLQASYDQGLIIWQCSRPPSAAEPSEPLRSPRASAGHAVSDSSCPESHCQCRASVCEYPRRRAP